ncbi:MAG: L-aspartate oxidase [Planctomycetota bacterium]|jgi:L-aspartate oxidase
MEDRLHSPRYITAFDTHRLPHVFTDVLVIGCGAAGLRAAVEAAESAEVVVLAKRRSHETNTHHAQGGIAAAVGEGDSPQAHARDTLSAGGGLSEPNVVDEVTREGPDRIRELERWGARFDREGEKWALAQEGGHTIPRLVRSRGDATGAELQDVLIRRAQASSHIRFLENAYAVDLLTVGGRCEGALVHPPEGGAQIVRAGATVLATGGAGRLWRETTNPVGATGDGLAMAHRAGARIRDLEFMQFHPTALYLAGAARFLISEAARGEGGVLRDSEGNRFMSDAHPMAELAPRDVVSQSIARVIRQRGDNCVYLDMRHLDAEHIRARFPAIASHLAGYGIDMGTDLIPVRPSAHYTIGGVITDLEGATNLPALFAAGEVASTGLHGANRLGSNSLLEALVFGRRAGRSAAAMALSHPLRRSPPEITSRDRGEERSFGDIHFKDFENSLQSLMWRSVGLEREEGPLMEALEKIAFWSGYIMPRRFEDIRGFNLQNMLLVARLIVRGALRRQESRGVHYRTDFPRPAPEWQKGNESDPFENGP